MRDPYLDELKNDFDGYSKQIKKLQKKLLKTDSDRCTIKNHQTN